MCIGGVVCSIQKGRIYTKTVGKTTDAAVGDVSRGTDILSIMPKAYVRFIAERNKPLSDK